MKTQHTPGPWTVTGKEMNDVRDSGDHIVACAFHIRWPLPNRSVQEATANARLIAAAPDLLEALKQLVSVAIGTEHGREFEYQVDIALAAINKATGD